MKTLEQVITGYISKAIDGRDVSRLVKYIPEDRLEEMGIELKEEFKGKHTTIPFSKENILEDLKGDVAFGFEKALNQRGISSGLMYNVVEMWNWILEEGLEDFDNYAQYGLPLFKATAELYGFPNPIGQKQGNEKEFASEEY